MASLRIMGITGHGLHPHARQPGRDDKGNGQRQQHAQARIDRDRAHVRAHQAAHKRHGQQRRDHSEGGQDGGAAHFIHRTGDDFTQGFPGEKLLVAVDVFHHHDGIVHQNADGKNQRKQRHAVEREAPGP